MEEHPNDRAANQLDEASAAMVRSLTLALKANVPETTLPADAREPLASEFLDSIGRLLQTLESIPPGPAGGAALLYVVQKLNLDQAGEEGSTIMLTLVQAMQQIHQGIVLARARAAT